MHRIFRALLLVLVLAAVLAFYHFLLHPAAALTPVSPVRTFSSRVVLVPTAASSAARTLLARPSKYTLHRRLYARNSGQYVRYLR